MVETAMLIKVCRENTIQIHLMVSKRNVKVVKRIIDVLAALDYERTIKDQ